MIKCITQLWTIALIIALQFVIGEVARADLPGSSTVSAPSLLVSNVGINGTQGNGNFYKPNTWVFVANNPASSSLSFSLSEDAGKQFTINSISFEHAEYLFNANNGWPAFQLSVSSASLLNPLVYNIPYNYIWNLYTNQNMVSFSQIINSTLLSSANIAITIYNVGDNYGSPSVSIRNVEVKATIVPEPSSLSLLLACGVMVALRRQKRA
jgi:hypothetical protein